MQVPPPDLLFKFMLEMSLNFVGLAFLEWY